MHITDLLLADAVYISDKTSNKPQIIKWLAKRAAGIVGLPDSVLVKAIEAREAQGSTALGGGVAVPHARIDGIARPFTVFALLEIPIDFAAVDGLPVDIVCLLVSPIASPTSHLRALACVSRLLRDRELLTHVRGCHDTAAIYAVLTHAHRARAA